MKQELAFRNTTGRSAAGVRAMFMRSRTSLLSYHVSALPSGVHPVSVDVNPYGVEILWNPPIPDGGEACLSVDVLGEFLVVDRVIWRDAGGALRRPTGPLGPEDALLLGVVSMWDLANHAAAMDSVRCSMLAVIPDSEFRRFHEFFCDLDLHTHPKLIPLTTRDYDLVARRTTVIMEMLGCLHERVFQRLEWAKQGHQTPAENLVDMADSDYTREISDLQLKIYADHLSEGGVLAVELVWDAFSRFANGELQLRKTWKEWDAAPVGAALFYFAEFAFMACDLDAEHSRKWEPLLWPLTAIQEIYSAAYRPGGGDPEAFRFSDYNQANWRRKKMVSRDRKRELRAEYETLDPDELRVRAGRNARAAFPGGA